MYQLHHPVSIVAGVGPSTAEKFQAQNINTIRDLLLFVPNRYEDRSAQKKIGELMIGELVTIQAEVVAISNQYRGRKSMQRATVKDDTGSLKLIWFNSPFLQNQLIKGQSYFISGQLNQYGQMSQPKVEKISGEALHTNRLVPIYPSITGINQGNLRRFLKEIIDHLADVADPLAKEAEVLSLNQTFRHLHFPDDQELTIKARERLALEELLALMQRSHQIKEQWQQAQSAPVITPSTDQIIPDTVPFKLTAAQLRCLDEILVDLNSSTPMNRLLIGDVGSGKTVVAGIAAAHTLQHQLHAVLIAPTQILAEQHLSTIKQLFPQLPLQLLTAKSSFSTPTEPTFFIGTHAAINQFQQIQPAYVIYDEQHRFGVNQRSEVQKLAAQPHVLTMSATPIPRSIMLTIFSHLDLSVIDEMPAGRKEVKTWLVPEKKRADAYTWLQKLLVKEKSQALVVCPFIDPSVYEGFEQVAAATEIFDQIKTHFPDQQVELLHGRLAQSQKDRVIKNLFAQKIKILVTTPMVEVGVDLPAAQVMLIESAERFGLASLHQLRGRVGRAGQQAYCLLFTKTKSRDALKRLQIFTTTHDGMKLAEFDLENRGAGDLFGTEQHGFDQLRFASWANLELIAQARKIFEQYQPQLSQESPWLFHDHDLVKPINPN